jgi:desulfoferrodoxin (superoxide reductase-like protein)
MKASQKLALRQVVMSRRQILQSSAGLIGVAIALPPAVGGCLSGSQPITVERNYVWEQRASQLESGGVLTQTNPGAFAGKEAAHVPQVTYDSRSQTVVVFTDHPMAKDHWITTQYIRNQDGVVIGLKEYSGGDAEARATFILPQGTTSITVFSYCNLHGDWTGASTDV